MNMTNWQHNDSGYVNKHTYKNREKTYKLKIDQLTKERVETPELNYGKM